LFYLWKKSHKQKMNLYALMWISCNCKTLFLWQKYTNEIKQFKANVTSRLLKNWFRHGLNNNGILPLHLACMHLSSYNSMRIISLIYPEGLTVRYNDTQLPLHDAVARDPPLNSTFIQMLVSKNAESVNETTLYGQNMLHIALNLKMYLNA